MRRSRFPRFILFLVLVFAISIPLSFIIMALWNNILVAVVHGVSVINFWQALGLFALSKIFFGGFSGKPGWGGHGRRRREMEEMRSKWFNLSPEEKKHFRQDWKNRCSGRQTVVTPESSEPAGTE